MLVGFCRRVGADHFQEGEAEAEGVELLGVALFEVPLALAELGLGGGVGALLFFEGVDVFDADVADLDLSVVGVDVDGLTGQFAVDDLVLVQEHQALEHLARPVLDHLEARRDDLLAVPRD